MATVLNEDLVSRNAKDRFERWFEDLKRAEAKVAAVCNYPSDQRTPTPSDFEASNTALRRDHQAAILNATWNEGQPDSPYHSNAASEHPSAQESAASSQTSLANATSRTTPTQPLRSPLTFIPALQGPRLIKSKRPRPPVTTDILPSGLSSSLPSSPASKRPRTIEVSLHDRPASEPSPPTPPEPPPSASPALSPDDTLPSDDPYDYANYARHKREDRDLITDTVGAIAIDLHGHIAAGSSSGGIGMKHRGRVGPAALVGIGTAVIPADPSDADAVSVAAVTSGTGEHMATTMASHKCAERLYHSTRRGEAGRDVEECDEDRVMESFVSADFMGHPGVRNQPSASAIGVMAVKKSRQGYYFYFAHNTDSFALASMSSNERGPVCTMSRTPETNMVIRGGRKIRVE